MGVLMLVKVDLGLVLVKAEVDPYIQEVTFGDLQIWTSIACTAGHVGTGKGRCGMSKVITQVVLTKGR